MDFDESVAWLSGLKRHGIKLGLDRFRELLTRWEEPHRAFPSVHVAGTNGKGSTTAMIAAALQNPGRRVGLYLSPYVFDFRERIQIDGEMIPRERFAALATRARTLVEKVEGDGFGQATEFEVKTLIGFEYFGEEGVEIACVEVGLGGRLDATNVIKPLVSVITSVFFDHMEHLGDTLAAIAAEKAGIIKYGVPVVTAALEPEALAVIRETALERSAALRRVCPCPAPEGGVCWRLRGDGEGFDLLSDGWALTDVRPRLKGDFQAANAGCAAAALLELRRQGWKVSDEGIREGIESAWLPGRLQVLGERPLIIVDGAHNPAGAEVVARHLGSPGVPRPLALVVGMMRNHEPEEVLRSLLPLAERVIASSPPAPGAWTAEEIASVAEGLGTRAEAEPDVNAAVRKAAEFVGPGGAVCVTGSFYLVGALRLGPAVRD